MYPVKTYNCRCKVVAYFPNHSKDRGTGKSVESYNKWLDENLTSDRPKNRYFGSNQKFLVNDINKAIKDWKIEYIEPQKNSVSEMEESKIISKISKEDYTNGNCSSLALTYIGNKMGYDVEDFKSEESRLIFGDTYYIRQIAKFDGVKSIIVSGKNDYQMLDVLLSKIEVGKEYYLGIGNHASIVKKTDEHYSYLNLQKDRGAWYKWGSKTAKRFGCFENNEEDTYSILIDCESLEKSEDFKKILGYLNTKGIKK